MKKVNHPHVVRLLEVIDDPLTDKIYMGTSVLHSHSALRPPPVSRLRTFYHSILRASSIWAYSVARVLTRGQRERQGTCEWGSIPCATLGGRKDA